MELHQRWPPPWPRVAGALHRRGGAPIGIRDRHCRPLVQGEDVAQGGELLVPQRVEQVLLRAAGIAEDVRDAVGDELAQEREASAAIGRGIQGRSSPWLAASGAARGTPDARKNCT